MQVREAGLHGCLMAEKVDVHVGNSGPAIAKFYRRGIIEAWGRGTIRMRELLEAAGLPAPEFECDAGEVLVRFRPGIDTRHGIRTPLKSKSQLESRLESQLKSGVESLKLRVLDMLVEGTLSKSEISSRLGQEQVSGQLHAVMRTLIQEGLVAYTIPERRNSRLQRYVLTPVGRSELGLRS